MDKQYISWKYAGIIAISTILALVLVIALAEIDKLTGLDKAMKTFASLIISAIAFFIFNIITGFATNYFFKEAEYKIINDTIHEVISRQLDSYTPIIIKSINDQLIEYTPTIETAINQHLSDYIPAMYQEDIIKNFVGIKIIDNLHDIKLPRKISTNNQNNNSAIIKMMFISFELNFLNDSTLNGIASILKNRESKIHLLVLSTECEAFNLRAKDREGDYNINPDNLQKSFEDRFDGIDFKNQVEIREYDVYPAFTFVSIGNYTWFTPIWNGISIKRQPFLELYHDKNHDRNKLSKKIHNNFDIVWNKKSRNI